MKPLIIALLSVLPFTIAGAQPTDAPDHAGAAAPHAGDDHPGEHHDDGHPAGDAHRGAGAAHPVADVGKVHGALDDIRGRIQRGDSPERIAAITQEAISAHSLSPDEQDMLGEGLRMWMRDHVPAGTGGNTMADTPEGRHMQTQPGSAVLSGINERRKGEHPRDPGVFIVSGRDSFQLGNFQAAYQDYTQALQLGSTSPETYLGYGNAAYRLGDYALATQAAKVVLAADPNNKEAIALYHFAKDRVPTVTLPSVLGELAEEREAGSTPSGGSAANSAPAAVAASAPSGMTAEQVAQYASQAALAGPDGAARSRQFAKDAEGALGVKDYSSAYQLATQAVQLNPKNAQALNYRAIALSRQGQYAEAAQDASAALALAPSNAAALLTRSEALSRQGKYSDALSDAEAVLSGNPKNAYAWQGKAFALAGLHRNPSVLDALRRSADLDPRFATRLERALQLPQDSDMKLLFEESGAAAPGSSPGPRPGRFLRLLALTAIGGLLIALGTLHVVSSSWRDKVTATVRRALGSGLKTGVASAQPGGAFWTQYELVKEIGFGGMGVVYEAKDRSLERRVAVKRMRDEIRLDPQDRRRFVNEARLVAQLHHPNIVDIYGIVEDGADVYLVFEFVSGRTLEDVLKSDGPMEFKKARKVLKEMAAAVAHAHERSVIHRDLKPSNVMIASEGHVKVMDFGVARQAKEAMTRHTNTVVGTPPYMAPEQEQGTVRKESDVYAMGVCLYEMLTGQLPFKGSGAAMLLSKLNGRLTPASQRVPSLPSGIDAVIAKALAPEPDQRYRTPSELVAALEGLTTAVRA